MGTTFACLLAIAARRRRTRSHCALCRQAVPAEPRAWARPAVPGAGAAWAIAFTGDDPDPGPPRDGPSGRSLRCRRQPICDAFAVHPLSRRAAHSPGALVIFDHAVTAALVSRGSGTRTTAPSPAAAPEKSLSASFSKTPVASDQALLDLARGAGREWQLSARASPAQGRGPSPDDAPTSGDPRSGPGAGHPVRASRSALRPRQLSVAAPPAPSLCRLVPPSARRHKSGRHRRDRGSAQVRI